MAAETSHMHVQHLGPTTPLCNSRPKRHERMIHLVFRARKILSWCCPTRWDYRGFLDERAGDAIVALYVICRICPRL